MEKNTHSIHFKPGLTPGLYRRQYLVKSLPSQPFYNRRKGIIRATKHATLQCLLLFCFAFPVLGKSADSTFTAAASLTESSRQLWSDSLYAVNPSSFSLLDKPEPDLGMPGPLRLTNENDAESEADDSHSKLSLDSIWPRVDALLPEWMLPHTELSNHYHASHAVDGSLPRPPTHLLLKTGTTIVGVCGPDYCIIGADTRATSSGGGSLLVADSRATKLHWLTQTAVAAGAGTSADLQHVTRQAALSLALYEQGQGHVGNQPCRLAVKQQSKNDIATGLDKESLAPPDYLAHRIPVGVAIQWLQQTLFQANGSIQAYLIVAGLDSKNRPRLYALYPHGSVDRNVAYTALGSGGYHAMAILESRYRPDLTVAQAQKLVRDALAAGITNDLGSGSQMDVCVITADGGVDYQRSTVPTKKVQEADYPVSYSDEQAGVNGFGGVPSVIQTPKSKSTTLANDPWARVLKELQL